MDVSTEDEDAAARIAAAHVVGTPGDVLGGLDEASVAAGRLAGRVDVLTWAQAELQRLLTHTRLADRFADTRPLEEFLVRVQDSLRSVQDGTGEWAGLVRTDVGESVGTPVGLEGPPSVEDGM